MPRVSTSQFGGGRRGSVLAWLGGCGTSDRKRGDQAVNLRSTFSWEGGEWCLAGRDWPGLVKLRHSRGQVVRCDRIQSTVEALTKFALLWQMMRRFMLKVVPTHPGARMRSLLLVVPRAFRPGITVPAQAPQGALPLR